MVPFFHPRYELKYLISASVAQELEGALTGHCHLDDHGEGGCYVNETLYFDSPQLDFFFQKIEGVRLRRKVRIRRHGDTGPWEKVFVEVKRRKGQYIEKARFPLSTDLYPFLFDFTQREMFLRTLTHPEIQVYNEVQALTQLFHLRPIVFIRYKRKAFWARGDARLRITFDSKLSYDMVHRDCFTPLENTQPLLEEDQQVMEIKANGRVPFWVLELIKKHGCRMVRFSKYCLGVERSQGLTCAYLTYGWREVSAGTL